MKILVYSTQDDRSEQYVFGALARRGHKVQVVCAPEALLHMPLEANGVSIGRLKTRHRLDLVAARAFRRILMASRPDVIYAPRNKTLSVALMATMGLGIPVVAYRGTIGHIHYSDPASWLTYLNPRLAHIHCVSEAVRRHLDQDLHIPSVKLSCIYKGHDVAWYAPPEKAAVWPESVHLPDDAFVVAFTGNIRPVKGVDVLLDAVRGLIRDSRIHVVLIGEIRDPAIERMVTLPGIRERVHTTGFRRDAAQLVGLADAFVMPSVEREGLPRAVIEAMSQSIPVVVSDVGGMPELVEHERSGLVVPPRDAVRLRAALTRLEGDAALQERLGAAGRERIETVFNIETTVNKMESLFSAVVRRSPKTRKRLG